MELEAASEPGVGSDIELRQHVARVRLTLNSGRWNDRRWQARLFKTALCSACNKQRSANAGNMPCGHCVFCMDCAEVWRARHGVRCSKCAQPARLEMTFAEQTCCICFEVATANDISGVEDIANEFLCD